MPPVMEKIVVQCPKCKEALIPQTLEESLAIHHCGQCHGHWTQKDDYDTWQQHQPQEEMSPERVLGYQSQYEPAPQDTKAALCPECQRYLSRTKVEINPPFYVERCPECQGVWQDPGEWEVLKDLGLHHHLEHLFTPHWFDEIQEKRALHLEQLDLTQKLGEDLARQVFAITSALAAHPQGEFAASYIMRHVLQYDPKGYGELLKPD